MHESAVLNAIIQAVPQWYVCSSGKNVQKVSVNNCVLEFCSHHPLGDKLTALLEFIHERLPQWMQQQPKIPTPNSIAKLKEEMVLKWLDLHDASIDWNKWIAHAEGLKQRTYENKNLRINMIISQGKGLCDIMDVRLQKVFDPLATHPHVYMRVDQDLRFLDYDEIQWKEVKDSVEYKFSPEFMQPFLSILSPGEYFLQITGKGEIIIANQNGMLASCRKGQWYLYEQTALRHCIADIVGNDFVGRNLIEILFDLSYRRQGALLIFDPSHKVIQHVVNPESLIIDPKAEDLARKLLAPRIKAIHMGSASYRERKKLLFLEISEIDGAVIFEASQVLGFGSMIQPHPKAGSYFGARTMAAQSAFHWGGHSFMISSDGEILIFFADRDSGEQVELRFM